MWSTLAGMDRAAKLRQLFVRICFGTGPDATTELHRLDSLRAAAPTPYPISADLEGSRTSLPFGTEVPNPLALVAAGGIQASGHHRPYPSRLCTARWRGIGMRCRRRWFPLATPSTVTTPRAPLDCRMGRTPFQRQNPLDPFCGLPDARF